LHVGDESEDDDNCNLRVAIVEQHLKNLANTNDIIITVLKEVKEQSLEQLREQVEKVILTEI
jgi:RNase P protein component